ncbi:MAG: DUF1353 domain-containing protein, partial [Deltaproteobacteria bacterium]|nr:DUF1353 domain-containing protein [Deltaproteobacteria bacterium]
MASTVPWRGSFEIDSADESIDLAQTSAGEFKLGATITYVGDSTGLEDVLDPDALQDIRQVSPTTLPRTDLASVPTALTWLVGRYGAHTPAVLIHDRLIGGELPEGMTEVHADRYFRFMLADLKIPLIRRWLIFTAVALRTRFASGGLARLSLTLWILGSIAGHGVAIYAAVAGTWWLFAAAALAPVLFAGLWGRQYGAGIVGAYSAPGILPPTLLGVIGYWVYWILERA